MAQYQHKNSDGIWEDCTEQDYNDCHKDFRRAENKDGDEDLVIIVASFFIAFLLTIIAYYL